MPSTNLLSPIGAALREKIDKRDAQLFALTFLLSMLTHLYLFTRKILNHDDIGGLFGDASFGLSSGRWFLQPLTRLGGAFSAPWVSGVLGSIFLALACVLVCRLLGVRQLLAGGLVGLCMVAFPPVAATYVYLFTSDQYLFALLTAAAAAYLIFKARWITVLAGGALLALGMGCYQSYLGFAAALLLLALIFALYHDRYESFSGFVRHGFVCLGGLALGLALYFIILRVLLFVTGTELVDYQGISSMGIVSLSELLQRIKMAYLGFGHFFLDNPYSKWLGLALPADALLLVYALWQMKGKTWQRLCMLALCVLLPLGCGLIYVMVSFVPHALMIYAFVLPIILPTVALCQLALPEGKARRVLLPLAGLVLLLQLGFGYLCYLYCNRAYLTAELATAEAQSYYTRLAARIEQTEGFAPDTPVLLVGQATVQAEPIPMPQLTGFLSYPEMITMYSRDTAFWYLAGVCYAAPSDAQRERILPSADLADMPCYPAAGSVQQLEGVIVVKLSEPARLW